MNIEVLNRNRMVINGLSLDWLEANQSSIEDIGVDINMRYVLGAIEFMNPTFSSLDFIYVLEYICCFQPEETILWIGNNPADTDKDGNTAAFFPCSQDALIIFDDHHFVIQFEIQAIMEDSIAFYVELLDSLERHVWLTQADFVKSVYDGVTISLDFLYLNDFIEFLNYLTQLEGIFLTLKIQRR